MDPLTPLAVAAAGQSIKPLARGVSRLADFASVLAAEVGSGSAAADQGDPASAGTMEEVTRQATEIVDRLLGGLAIETNRPLRIDVLADGELRLADDHPRAAEIEALLNNDKALRDLTSRIGAGQNGGIPLRWPASSLTESGLSPYTMGMQRPFGGYANW